MAHALVRGGETRSGCGWLDRIATIWSQPAGLVGDACALILVLTIAALTAFIGAVHTRIFGHDIFLVFDAGWRVLNGQRPDVDFSPSMGPLLGSVGGGRPQTRE